MLKPLTHTQKKIFSRKFFNSTLSSARSTKRLIKTVFWTKMVRKIVIWKSWKKGNLVSEWLLNNSGNGTFLLLFSWNQVFPVEDGKFAIYPPILTPHFREGIPLLWVFATTFRNPVLLTSGSSYFPALNLSSDHLSCLCFLFPHCAMSSFLTWSHIAAAVGVRPLFHSAPSSVGWCFEPTAAPSFWKRWAQNETFSG